MERVQERKYSMYLAVNNYMKSVDTTVIDKMPTMPEALEALQKNIDEIRVTAENQRESRKGYKQSKDVTKEDVANIFFVLSAAVKSYAISIDDLVLSNQVTFTYAGLKNMADSFLEYSAGIILEKANEHVVALAPFGVTPASIANVTALLATYTTKMAQPRNAISDKVEDTKLLKLAIGKTDKLLSKKMDVLIGMIKISDNSVFDKYHTNRNIIGPGYYTLALRVNVTDHNLIPLDRVKITIGGIDKIYRTTEKGNIQIKSLPEGMQKATISLVGFQTQVIDFPIIKGKRTDLRIILLPL